MCTNIDLKFKKINAYTGLNFAQNEEDACKTDIFFLNSKRYYLF
ncbi:hypothetical protein [Flavobacterium jejuense]|nr:hypothetical protein [Flavobacterium jejuense]